jgi:hypothetical protein
VHGAPDDPLGIDDAYEAALVLLRHRRLGALGPTRIRMLFTLLRNQQLDALVSCIFLIYNLNGSAAFRYKNTTPSYFSIILDGRGQRFLGLGELDLGFCQGAGNRAGLRSSCTPQGSGSPRTGRSANYPTHLHPAGWVRH